MANPTLLVATLVLRQFFTAVESEPGAEWTDGAVRYNSCFSDNRGWETEEGRIFDVIPAEGQLCNLSVSQKGGTLDANDGAVLRTRVCRGGDASACRWENLGLEVDIAPDNGMRDVRWTNGACAKVSAGDAVACQWDLDAGAAWERGDLEAPEAYVEFLSRNRTDSVLLSNAVHGTDFDGLYCWSIAGGNEYTYADPTQVQVPLPGPFTLSGMAVSFAARPAASTTVFVCKADGGGAAGCGGAKQGSVRMSCDVKASGPSRCASSTCLGGADACEFAAGERLFACTTRNDSNNLRALGLEFSNANGQWFSAHSMGGINPVEIEFSRRGPNSVQMCNHYVDESPQCMPLLPSAWTVQAIQGHMTAPLSAGSLDVSPRRNGRDVKPICSFTPPSRDCSAAASQTFEANDSFNLQATPSSAPKPAGGGAWGVSLLWDSPASAEPP